MKEKRTRWQRISAFWGAITIVIGWLTMEETLKTAWSTIWNIAGFVDQGIVRIVLIVVGFGLLFVFAVPVSRLRRARWSSLCGRTVCIASGNASSEIEGWSTEKDSVDCQRIEGASDGAWILKPKPPQATFVCRYEPNTVDESARYLSLVGSFPDDPIPAYQDHPLFGRQRRNVYVTLFVRFPDGSEANETLHDNAPIADDSQFFFHFRRGKDRVEWIVDLKRLAIHLKGKSQPVKLDHVTFLGDYAVVSSVAIYRKNGPWKRLKKAALLLWPGDE